MKEDFDRLEKEKSAILPPFLTRDELKELLDAWHRLYTDPSIKVANARFIVDPKLYQEPAFAKLARHPAVQDAARRTIGEFKLAGYSVVATPRNGDEPTTPEKIQFHIDHCVYSDTPVSQARDTFVCIWVNFEDVALENGPFVLARDTDKFNLGYEFFESRRGLTIQDMGWDRRAIYNICPAGTTAVYSGKTWHAGTVNCSNQVRKGLNFNFVPARPLDTLKRNPFDACALSEEAYEDLTRLLGPDYLIAWDPAMSGAAAAKG